MRKARNKNKQTQNKFKTLFQLLFYHSILHKI